MKNKHSKMKWPLIVVAPTIIVTPLLISSSQISSNNNLTLKTDLNAAQYVKVIFKSNIPGTTFGGQTVVKAKKGAIFGSITKPKASVTGCVFAGWYSDSEYSTRIADTYKIEAPTTVWAKFQTAPSQADYTIGLKNDDNVTESYILQNPQALYSGGTDTLTLKKNDGSTTQKTISPDDQTAWSKIISLTIGPEVTVIGNNFLKGFTYFNASILFNTPKKLVSIGNNFASDLPNFNHPITFPSDITSLRSIGSGFLNNNPKLASITINLPNSLKSIGKDFIVNCPLFRGTINTGTLEADVFTADNTSLSCSNVSTSFASGITIKGDHKEEILSDVWTPIYGVDGYYRRTIGASFQNCTWKYLNAVAKIYESLDQSKDSNKKYFYSCFLKDDTNFATSFDDLIGLEKIVKVNGQEHRVRVVDCNHDTIADNQPNAGKKTALTFEFANLISDSEGNSLATAWQTEEPQTNFDYLHSTIRWNLEHVGKGSIHPSTYCYWYVKEGFHETDGTTNNGKTHSTTYAGKCVLDMINNSVTGTPDLFNALKVVSKSVATTNEDLQPDWEVASYDTRLFLPTVKEISTHAFDSDVISGGVGTTYNYYTSHQSPADLLKKQVNESVQSTDFWFVNNTEKPTSIPMINHAGHNDINNSNDGMYWTCNPSSTIDETSVVFSVIDKNGIYDNDRVYTAAIGVAPLFCI